MLAKTNLNLTNKIPFSSPSLSISLSFHPTFFNLVSPTLSLSLTLLQTYIIFFGSVRQNWFRQWFCLTVPLKSWCTNVFCLLKRYIHFLHPRMGTTSFILSLIWAGVKVTVQQINKFLFQTGLLSPTKKSGKLYFY